MNWLEKYKSYKRNREIKQLAKKCPMTFTQRLLFMQKINLLKRDVAREVAERHVKPLKELSKK